MHVAEEMHDMLGPGQQRQIALDNDAVETVVYKNQEAFEKLGEGFAFFAAWRLGEKLKGTAMTENAIAKEIVEAAFRIHTVLGPGLLESVYDAVLAYELGPPRSPHGASAADSDRLMRTSSSVIAGHRERTIVEPNSRTRAQ